MKGVYSSYDLIIYILKSGHDIIWETCLRGYPLVQTHQSLVIDAFSGISRRFWFYGITIPVKVYGIRFYTVLKVSYPVLLSQI